VQRLILSILLIISIYSLASSQIKQKSAERVKADYAVTQLDALIDSAIFYKDIDYKKSVEFIELGFKINNRDKDQELDNSGKLNEILGDIYLNLGQYDLANEKYKLASQGFSVLPASLLIKQIDLNIEIQDYKAAKNLLEFLSASTRTDKVNLDIYWYRGELLSLENEVDSAQIVFQQGLDLAHSLNDNTYIILFDNKIAEIFSQKGDLETAEKHLNESFKNAAELDVNSQMRQAETNAAFYRKNNKLDDELSLRKSNVEVLQNMDQDESVQKEIQYQHLQIADAYIEKLKYKKAIPYLKKSADPVAGPTDLNIEIQATKKLSQVYEEIGEYDLALDNYRKYVLLTDELYKEKEKEINEAVKLTNDLASKQKRIDVLELERDLSESKTEVYEKDKSIASLYSNKQKLLIYSLLGGLILAMIALFFFYKNNQQKKIKNNLLALKALKSQMNPHFIFNALNSVNHYIAINDERQANKYISDFSMLMRMVLDVSEKDFISLDEELKMIDLYVKLEHARFEDKFDYSVIVDKTLDLDKRIIPPMLIQPFIENAVWHGLRYKDSKGKLKIAFTKQNDTVQIQISDDGVGRKRSGELKSRNQLKRESKGMINTNERVRIINEMYHHGIKVDISDLKEDGSGTKVNIEIPVDFEIETNHHKG